MAKPRFNLGDLLVWVMLAGLIAAVFAPMFSGGLGSSLVQRLALSADGSTAAAIFTDGKVRVWDTADGRLRAVLETGVSEVWALALSPDGTSLAICRPAGVAVPPAVRRFPAARTVAHVVEFWDAASGKCVNRLPVAPGSQVVFAPNGERAAAVSQSGTIELYEPPLDKAIAIPLVSPKANIFPEGWNSPAFSPDGQLLAVRNTPAEIVVFNVTARQRQATLKVGEAMFGPLAFSPDGQNLIAPSTGACWLFEASGVKDGVCDFSNAERRRVNFDANVAADQAAALLADGKNVLLAYTGNLCIANLETGQVRQLDADGFFRWPAATAAWP